MADKYQDAISFLRSLGINPQEPEQFATPFTPDQLADVNDELVVPEMKKRPVIKPEVLQNKEVVSEIAKDENIYQKLLDNYQQLKKPNYSELMPKALEAQSNIGLISGLGRAGQTIADAIATGAAGGKIETDKSAWEQMAKQAGQPVETVSQLAKMDVAQMGIDTEREMNDPNSSISKLAVGMARKQLGQTNPDLAKQLTGLTASQLEKLGLKGLVSSVRQQYQLKPIQGSDGKITYKLFNTVTGQMADTGEEVGFAPTSYTDPYSGEKVFTTRSGQPVAKGMKPASKLESEVKPEDQKQKISFKSLELNPKQREAFADIEKDFIKDTGDIRKAGDSLLNIDRLLDSWNPAATPATKRQMARAIGLEVGVMTDKDVAAFGGDPSLLAKFNQWVEEMSTGKFTQDNYRLFKDLVKNSKVGVQNVISNKVNYHADRFQKRAPEVSREDAIQLFAPQSAMPAGVLQNKVKVQKTDKSGKKVIGEIPSEKLEEAKKKGWEEVK